ncbi:helix-turn-helix domain-containing protein [Gordonia polyisoprenivorans]|uniref:helix-turn-helix domain-containing protein n=1 Tax=Gordonia polyisoprenivorans TaxID=84595 RepID=UPI00223486D3|nr:helix-turn-helix domain-containing protein [Gordonia polyisoprenivorans]
MRRRALANAVVDARRKAGLTQQQLADAAGLSRSAIARLELGEAGLNSDFLWSVAKALGTRPSVLFAAAEADEDAAKTLEP